MSTQFYTQDRPATSQPGTRRPHRDGPSWYRIAAVIIGAVAAAALIVLAISGLTGGSHPAPGHRVPARQPRAAVRSVRQPGAAVRPGRQPGPADDPGRPPVGGGQDAAAAP